MQKTVQDCSCNRGLAPAVVVRRKHSLAEFPPIRFLTLSEFARLLFRRRGGPFESSTSLLFTYEPQRERKSGAQQPLKTVVHGGDVGWRPPEHLGSGAPGTLVVLKHQEI